MRIRPTTEMLCDRVDSSPNCAGAVIGRPSKHRQPEWLAGQRHYPLGQFPNLTRHLSPKKTSEMQLAAKKYGQSAKAKNLTTAHASPSLGLSTTLARRRAVPKRRLPSLKSGIQ